jgi:hypothetical protein
MKAIVVEDEIHHKLTTLKVKYKFKTYTKLFEYLISIEEEAEIEVEE